MRHVATINKQPVSAERKACTCDICGTLARGIVITMDGEQLSLCMQHAGDLAGELSK